MKFMNFLIFLGFFWIFLNLFFIFKVLKKLYKRQKRGFIFTRVPRGCDVACKAMWQSHVNPRKHLRGVEVTRVYIFIFTRNIGL